MASNLLTVLHLIGSSETEYYANLSLLWARGSVNALQHRVSDCIQFKFAFVHPRERTSINRKNSDNPLDALWSFPSDLSDSALSNAPKYKLSQAKRRLNALNIDCCVTHMYDKVGTEVYRLLLDELKISFVGSSAQTMKISNHKQNARSLVAKHGVSIPKGLSITSSMNMEQIFNLLNQHGIRFPVMVKPCVQDNSIGLALVENAKALPAAIRDAIKYDDEVVVEEYIPLGRELRVGVIEKDEGYLVLPCIEYHLSANHRIRTNQDKFTKNAKNHSQAKSTVNCEVDSALRKKLEHLAITAHRALNARDFSLFDVRVDPDGNPYFIESNLYWSFSSKSILTLMAESTKDAKLSHAELFKTLVKKVAKRTHRMREARGQPSKL